MSFIKAAQFIERMIYPIIRIVYKIGMGIILGMMFLTVVDVIGRKFFDAPITGSYELTEFMLALIVFYSVGYTQIQKGHIAMEAFVSRFPPKAQAVIESIVYCVSLGLVSLMTWQLVAHAKRTWIGNNVSGVLNLPLYPFIMASALGSLLFCIVLFVDFLISLGKVKNES